VVEAYFGAQVAAEGARARAAAGGAYLAGAARNAALRRAVMTSTRARRARRRAAGSSAVKYTASQRARSSHGSGSSARGWCGSPSTTIVRSPDGSIITTHRVCGAARRTAWSAPPARATSAATCAAASSSPRAVLERGILAEVPAAEAGAPPLLRWVKRDAPIAVPSSIEDVLATRFDRLPPQAKETLLHAAVLGRQLTVGATSALIGRAARADLDELVRRGLLVAVADASETFRFKNDMIRRWRGRGGEGVSSGRRREKVLRAHKLVHTATHICIGSLCIVVRGLLLVGPGWHREYYCYY